MITRDFILRQVHQLAGAIAQALFHKQAGELEQVQRVVEATLEEVTGMSMDRLRQLGRVELLELCSTEGTFHSDKAVAMADLLREDSTTAGWERALWLYEAALDAGGAVPLDVHDRMDALRESLRDFR